MAHSDSTFPNTAIADGSRASTTTSDASGMGPSAPAAVGQAFPRPPCPPPVDFSFETKNAVFGLFRERKPCASLLSGS